MVSIRYEIKRAVMVMSAITFMYVYHITNLLTKWWTFMELNTVRFLGLETLLCVSVFWLTSYQWHKVAVTWIGTDISGTKCRFMRNHYVTTDFRNILVRYFFSYDEKRQYGCHMEISAFSFSFDGNGNHCILSYVWSYILNIVTYLLWSIFNCHAIYNQEDGEVTSGRQHLEIWTCVTISE